MQAAYDVLKEANFSAVEYFENASDETVEKVLSKILDYVNDGDFVLLKASHGMNFDRIAEGLKNG